ncbi:MAG: aspartate/tyrosine/aromatic aminotransferase [Sedimentisphaerales bacterium]|nr:aspartate/tyrosine/aromatic aminotransferase [Sedimentisphaerales bacterium]
MFQQLEPAPADPILGLTEAFKADTNPNKINLGVGIYKDAQGNTPIFSAVKKAEQKILQTETTKNYLPIPGAAEYAAAVQKLLFGADHPIVTGKRAATAHTPGGTGALRVAGDFLKKIQPNAQLHVSDPTWANHKGIFGDAGFTIKTYPYYDAATKSLNFDALIAALKNIPAGDIVLLHACCHNPTGVDPNAQQWQQIAEVIQAQQIFPIIDFAYQGFGNGLEEDTVGLKAIAAVVPEFIVASSYSKNFGLYNERVAAFTIVTEDASATQAAFSHVKTTIRRNYSNPPSHGGAIITTILNDPELTKEWRAELEAACQRIHQMRTSFVESLKAKGVTQDFSFITKQNGMFSFSGLTKEQVHTLRDKYAIYIVDSGRINVAGITPSNIDRLTQAIADIL